MKIKAKGHYHEYDEIEIDVEELDKFQLEWIVKEAQKKKLVPEPRTQEIEFVEEALSLLWQKDLIGLEKLITRLYHSQEALRQKFLQPINDQTGDELLQLLSSRAHQHPPQSSLE